MIKKKYFISVIAIVAVVCIFIGCVIGKFAFCADESANPADSEETAENSENQYPFEAYTPFLTNSDNAGAVIDKLNANPIDEKYYEKYISAKSLGEEQEILAAWGDAWAAEFENAKVVLEGLIDNRSDLENEYITQKELLELLSEFCSACPTYCETSAQLAYGFENYVLGYGTDHVYNLLDNSLKINRENTLSKRESNPICPKCKIMVHLHIFCLDIRQYACTKKSTAARILLHLGCAAV